MPFRISDARYVKRTRTGLKFICFRTWTLLLLCHSGGEAPGPRLSRAGEGQIHNAMQSWARAADSAACRATSGAHGVRPRYLFPSPFGQVSSDFATLCIERNRFAASSEPSTILLLLPSLIERKGGGGGGFPGQGLCSYLAEWVPPVLIQNLGSYDR